ncbi:hypothetical protein CWR43_29970 [Rhizobium sullae]|uniref:Uncharacterized protein n=1 Tax=Rhizobium sullae TaxID=50338 RepID=A0A2N0D1C7_RHISU|nr:hypothetical protein CWR43_29970 [Rhizobium sullae]
MYRFHLITNDTAHLYPGHIIHVGGSVDKVTGVLQIRDAFAEPDEEPLESAIHRALLVRQRDARAIGVKDDDGLWPDRLGTLVCWEP